MSQIINFGSDASASSPLTTDNDIYYYNSGDARLAGPSLSGEILTTNVDNILGWYNYKAIQRIDRTYQNEQTNTSGTGASLATGLRNGYCVITYNNGTDATGKNHYRNFSDNCYLREGSGKVIIDYVVSVNQLSNATDEYELQIGWHNRWNFGTGATDGIFFRYDRATDGANWRAVSRASATETNTDTSAAVSTSEQHLRIVIDNSATTVNFYINGSNVATHTSSDNIPPSTLKSSIATFTQNTAGTGSGRTMYVGGPLIQTDNS